MELTKLQQDQIMGNLYQDGKIFEVWNEICPPDEKIYENNSENWQQYWDDGIWDAMKLVEQSDICIYNEYVRFGGWCKTGDEFEDFVSEEYFFEKLCSQPNPVELLEKYGVKIEVDVAGYLDKVIELLTDDKEIFNIPATRLKADIADALDMLNKIKSHYDKE